MTTELITSLAESEIDCGVADTRIAELKTQYANVDATTKVGYEICKNGIREIVSLRTSVEAARKKLKKDPLEYCRHVDAEARRITDMLLEIEGPLKEAKEAVDNAAELARLAAIEKEKAAAEAKEAERRAAEEAKEAELRVAEQERFNSELAKVVAERAELEKQRAEMLAEQQKVREEQEAAQAKIDAENARIASEKEAAERAEREKAEKERAAKAAAERKEAERLAAIESARLAEERKPDVDKLLEYCERFANMDGPSLKTEWGHDILATFERSIERCCADLRMHCEGVRRNA